MGAQLIQMLVVFGIMFGMMYLLIIVPDKKRRKKYSSMLDAMKVNDKVTTKGGIVGKIINIKDDYIILESGPDRARIKMLKTGIFAIESNETKDVATTSEEKK
ncbi:preprotein translocase subunit YajC [Oceanirhabdus sp. W0125-5]|uniref:preprotein translocase subunit YajC n=1 Tax=Oceanirhabdus sp. W0125-5 TaxID=2999116 RepID=UPI0022F2AA8A|nr:preprotein translocase subunit YajC [Oceanirhabdus sp. W0125-5]WBW99529.1 preprotein translocase subunit YajC [Oceanirhabdus sp. W0125-5]